MISVLPDPASPFGRRVRDRFRHEEVIWLTTVGRDGTPQPNPVWFIWPGEAEILTYNMPTAHRLAHVAERPAVSLHFNSAEDGNDVVVARGLAERADGEPPPHESPAYLAKYREAMLEISGSLEAFASAYSVPVRIRMTRIRGY
ncbi:MAG TPA: TIGR03667 family PPOX class F420-dependent oxidoreductase [Jiangellaceae bacterium]